MIVQQGFDQWKDGNDAAPGRQEEIAVIAIDVFGKCEEACGPDGEQRVARSAVVEEEA